MSKQETTVTGSANPDAGSADKEGVISSEGAGGEKTAEQLAADEVAKNAQGKEGSDDTGKAEKDKQAPQKDAKDSVVPEKYDLKLPEGVLIDDALMQEFTTLGKELKWDNPTAQKMADMHLKAIGVFAQKQAEAHEEKLIGWHEELLNDKAFGGAKLDASMAQAKKVMTLAATIPGVNFERLKTDLDETGMTTHPDLVRVFNYLGQFIGEDNKFISGQSANTGPVDAATVLYGAEKK